MEMSHLEWNADKSKPGILGRPEVPLARSTDKKIDLIFLTVDSGVVEQSDLCWELFEKSRAGAAL